MNPLEVIRLVLTLEPEVQQLVVDVIAAAKAKDKAAERKAWEDAIVLQFEARKA